MSSVRKNFLGSRVSEVAKKLGVMWKSVDAKTKEKYQVLRFRSGTISMKFQTQAEENKAKYQEEMEAYRNSQEVTANDSEQALERSSLPLQFPYFLLIVCQSPDTCCLTHSQHIKPYFQIDLFPSSFVLHFFQYFKQTAQNFNTNYFERDTF